jgi:hypothetical protein
MHRWQNRNKVSELAQSRKQCEGVLVEDRMARSKRWSNSILEFWLPGFRIPGDGDVKDSHHQESRSAEMRKPETDASLGVLDTGISVTGRWRCQRLTSSGVSKCRNAKTRNRRITWSIGYRDFGYREMEMSKTLIIRSPEVAKCEMTPK